MDLHSGISDEIQRQIQHADSHSQFNSAHHDVLCSFPIDDAGKCLRPVSELELKHGAIRWQDLVSELQSIVCDHSGDTIQVRVRCAPEPAFDDVKIDSSDPSSEPFWEDVAEDDLWLPAKVCGLTIQQAVPLELWPG